MAAESAGAAPSSSAEDTEVNSFCPRCGTKRKDDGNHDGIGKYLGRFDTALEAALRQEKQAHAQTRGDLKAELSEGWRQMWGP